MVAIPGVLALFIFSCSVTWAMTIQPLNFQ